MTTSSRRHNRNSGYDTLGRESVNSFNEEISVKNSQSGTIDGNISINKNNSTTSPNKPASFLDSTETINRTNSKRETLHSRFEFIKVLGKGTYGKVKLANDKRTGKQVIFKLYLTKDFKKNHIIENNFSTLFKFRIQMINNEI